jgi:fructose-bisphosphate aldolase class 1
MIGSESGAILAGDEIEGTAGEVGRVAREVMGSLEVEATDVTVLGGVSLLDDGAGDSASTEHGLLNSAGLTLGVAWTLVMSFARSQ